MSSAFESAAAINNAWCLPAHVRTLSLGADGFSHCNKKSQAHPHIFELSACMRDKTKPGTNLAAFAQATLKALPFRHAVGSKIFSRDSTSSSPPNFKKQKVTLMGLGQRRQQQVLQEPIVQQSACIASVHAIEVRQTQMIPPIAPATLPSSSRHAKCEHKKRTTR
jgi:hypothetical protein